MDIIKSKRGRPATGRARDGVVFKRVPKEEEEVLKSLVDAAMDKALVQWQEKNVEYLKDGGWYFNQAVKEDVKAANPVAQESLSQIRALLDNVDVLTKELEEEKAKVVRALEMNLDEKGKLGWRLFFKLKNKEAGGKSEFDQS